MLTYVYRVSCIETCIKYRIHIGNRDSEYNVFNNTIYPQIHPQPERTEEFGPDAKFPDPQLVRTYYREFVADLKALRALP